MKTLFVSSSLILALFVASPAFSAEKASCDEMFKKADANGDGTVGGPEVAAFEAAYIKSGGHMNETTKIITKDQFMEACMKDAFKDMK